MKKLTHWSLLWRMHKLTVRGGGGDFEKGEIWMGSRGKALWCLYPSFLSLLITCLEGMANGHRLNVNGCKRNEIKNGRKKGTIIQSREATFTRYRKGEVGSSISLLWKTQAFSFIPRGHLRRELSPSLCKGCRLAVICELGMILSFLLNWSSVLNCSMTQALIIRGPRTQSGY